MTGCGPGSAPTSCWPTAPSAGAQPRGAARAGRVYKQVLSLLLAQRRPSYYLIAGRAATRELTDAHLRLLGAAHVVDAELARVALQAPLEFQPDPPQRSEPAFVELKAANAIRTTLLQRLGLQDLYQLDRLDLEVETSLDLPTQRRVARCCAG